MSFTLYEDQQFFYNNIRVALASQRRIIACAATGGGKTKVFVSMANACRSIGRTTLIITEAKKIYTQIALELPNSHDINADVKRYFIKQGECYIAMAQTLVKRNNLLEQFFQIAGDLIVIVDECHIGTMTKLLKKLAASGCYMVGFSATPHYRWAKHLPDLYNDIVVGPQPEYLVSIGRLTPYRHYARITADLDKLKMQNGEFTEESQENIFESKQVFDGLTKDLREVEYKKSIIFCCSIKDAEYQAEQLNAAGFKCIVIHSDTKKRPEKAQALDMAIFRDMNSGVDICVSVGILTKGFDFPAIDLVVLLRSTTSLPLYLQMIGRGSRKFVAQGFIKQYFTVLDYGGNFKRHGLWDADRDWSVLWRPPKDKKKRDGTAPVKMCPECEYIMPTQKMQCPNCGFVFVKEEAPPAETELIEITHRYRAEIVGKMVSQLSPKELALYAKLKQKNSYCIRVAKCQEQYAPGFLSDFAEEMGYNPSWLTRQYEFISDHIQQQVDAGQEPLLMTFHDFKLL